MRQGVGLRLDRDPAAAETLPRDDRGDQGSDVVGMELVAADVADP
jgi:hypothetical protein